MIEVYCGMKVLSGIISVVLIIFGLIGFIIEYIKNNVNKHK